MKRGQLPPLSAVSLDHRDWSVAEQRANDLCWVTPTGDAVRLRILAGPPPWTFDLTDLPGAAEFLSREAEGLGGVMLSLDVEEVRGLELLRGVFKYRAPVAGSLGMYYVGLLILPFQDYRVQVNVESMEHGTTGVREALVYALTRKKGGLAPEADAPVQKVNSMDEVFAQIAAAPVRRSPADDEQYDATFPDHPLSIVRSLLLHVRDTLQVSEPIAGAPPFRHP
jgi:hypothetical protein